MIFVGAPVTFISRGRPVRASHAVSTLPFRAGRDELRALGRRIGIKLIRQRYTVHEHLGLDQSRIERALRAGAIEVDWYRVIDLTNAKRRSVQHGGRP